MGRALLDSLGRYSSRANLELGPGEDSHPDCANLGATAPKAPLITELIYTVQHGGCGRVRLAPHGAFINA